MSYTFTEAEAEVRQMLGGRSSDLTSRATQWLRDAYLMLLSSEHSRYFHAVQEKSSSFTIITQDEDISEWTSDDVLYIAIIQDTTNNKIIDEKNIQSMIDKAVDADAIPRQYYRWEDTLYFNTTPTSSDNQPATTLWYVERPVAWTGSNLPLVPEEWQVVLVYMAVEIGWMALQNTEKRREMRELRTNTIREILHPREYKDDHVEWGIVPTKGPRSNEGLFHREA